MSPISYQGPLEADEKTERTHSQSVEIDLGLSQPGMTVSAILTHKGDEVHSVTRHTKIRELIAELTRLRVGALVVVDSANEPVGVVSERDVIHVANAKGADCFDGLVEDIMTADPVTCTPSDKIEFVAKQMADGGFRHMPVIDAGKIAGFLSMRDVMGHRLLEIEYENLKMKQTIVG